MQPENKQQCGWCQCELAKPELCARCHTQAYCGRDCQTKHWSLHKTRCPRETAPLTHNTVQEINKRVATLLSFTNPKDSVDQRDRMVQVLGCEHPLLSHWSQFLEVRASPVHGLGVFATRALPKDAVLTIYPCHLIGLDRAVLRVMDDAVPLEYDQERLQYWAEHYAFQLDSRTKLIGVPSQYSDKRLLGHMLNDSSLTNLFGTVGVEALRDARQLKPLMVAHYENVLRFTNCTYRQCHGRLMICVVAQREIAAGEELLVNYGLDYWFAVNYGASVDERFPFILQNTLKLRATDAEFRALSDRALEIDRAVMRDNASM